MSRGGSSLEQMPIQGEADDLHVLCSELQKITHERAIVELYKIEIPRADLKCKVLEFIKTGCLDESSGHFSTYTEFLPICDVAFWMIQENTLSVKITHPQTQRVQKANPEEGEREKE